MAELTAERARALLIYDANTGVFRWRVKPCSRILRGSVAGSVRPCGYRWIGLDGKFYQASRLAFLIATGSWPQKFVDHRNHCRCDDRWTNLREATPQQNQRNRKPLGEFKGVSRYRERFRARITVDGKELRLGIHSTAEAAARAYDVAAREKFGEFAFLNFPAEASA